MTIVEKIHNEIDTAEDRLLSEAKQIVGKTSFEKVDRLIRIGFTSSEEVVASAQARMSGGLARLIEHYKQRYPFQKFLTVAELDRICKKYNLIYAPIARYKKAVPEKNITDIEKVSLLQQGDYDNGYVLFKCSCATNLTHEEKAEVKKGIKIPIKEYRAGFNRLMLSNYFGRTITCVYDTIHSEASIIETAGLFIAAPSSHFNLTGLLKRGLGMFNFTVEPKDPIVFRYVRGGIQVITKWGIEAEDKDLLNEKMN